MKIRLRRRKRNGHDKESHDSALLNFIGASGINVIPYLPTCPDDTVTRCKHVLNAR